MEYQSTNPRKARCGMINLLLDNRSSSSIQDPCWNYRRLHGQTVEHLVLECTDVGFYTDSDRTMGTAKSAMINTFDYLQYYLSKEDERPPHRAATEMIL